MITKKDFDDYIRRDPYTYYGQLGIKHDKAFSGSGTSIYYQPRKRKNKLPTDNIKVSNSSNVKTPVNKEPKQKEPFLPEVDKWIDEHISIKTRRKIAAVFMIIGAIVGLGLSEQLGLSNWVAAILGAVAGLIIFPILIFSIKVLLFLMTLAFAGLVFYLIYLASTLI